MSDLTPSFKKFLIRWSLSRAGLIALVFVCINLFYNSWLSEKEKYVTKLFFDERIHTSKGPVFWVAFLIELLVLIVGLHYLYKGFSTVTGITEQWFNIKSNSPLATLLLSVGFIIALAIIMGMMLILYKITNSFRNRKLIITYILVDIFILMPFNFMFSYENNQKENLALFYSDAMPPLYDKLLAEVTIRRDKSGSDYNIIDNKNQSVQDDITQKKKDNDTAKAIFQRTNMEGLTQDQIYTIIANYNREIRNNNKEIKALENKIDSTVFNLKEKRDKYTGAYDSLLRIEPVIKGINNGRIKKADLYDTLITAKRVFLEVFNRDTSLRNDSTILYQIEKLQVTKEPPVDGFFNLLHDLFRWALKDSNVEASHDDKFIFTKAQKQWNEMLPKKRWFSFLFSILIDVFPLILALCYIHYARQKPLTHH
jgi:hypothetical protein